MRGMGAALAAPFSIYEASICPPEKPWTNEGQKEIVVYQRLARHLSICPFVHRFSERQTQTQKHSRHERRPAQRGLTKVREGGLLYIYGQMDKWTNGREIPNKTWVFLGLFICPPFVQSGNVDKWPTTANRFTELYTVKRQVLLPLSIRLTKIA